MLQADEIRWSWKQLEKKDLRRNKGKDKGRFLIRIQASEKVAGQPLKVLKRKKTCQLSTLYPAKNTFQEGRRNEGLLRCVSAERVHYQQSSTTKSIIRGPCGRRTWTQEGYWNLHGAVKSTDHGSWVGGCIQICTLTYIKVCVMGIYILHI